MSSNIKSKKSVWQEKKEGKRKEKSKPHFEASYPRLKEIAASLQGKSSAFTLEYDVARSAATHLQSLTVATAPNRHHTACAGQEQDSVLPAALDFMVSGAQYQEPRLETTVLHLGRRTGW